MLIVLACPTDIEGNYFARELAEKQSLRNLRKFSDKLAMCWDIIQQRKREKEVPKKSTRHIPLQNIPIKKKRSKSK